MGEEPPVASCVLFPSQHKDAYQAILDGVKGGTKEKRLAAQFIPKFFKHFPELADSAINAQLDLCEDEDVSVRIRTLYLYVVILSLYIFLVGYVSWEGRLVLEKLDNQCNKSCWEARKSRLHPRTTAV